MSVDSMAIFCMQDSYVSERLIQARRGPYVFTSKFSETWELYLYNWILLELLEWTNGLFLPPDNAIWGTTEQVLKYTEGISTE